MSDRPDYTLPVSIEAYTIETLPIDISAQTLGTVAIDISAQTLGQVSVNIAASAITMNVDITAQTVGNLDINIAGGIANIRAGYIVNPSFEDGETGWFLDEGAEISDAFPRSGRYCMKIPVGTYGYIKQAGITPPIDTNKIATFVAHQEVFNLADMTGITVLYSDGTYDETELIPSATGVYESFNVAYSADKYIVGIWWEFWGDVAAANMFLDDIFITQSIDQYASIVSSVTINMNILSQSVDINIKTSGGVNLVIDKLTQTAYVEDRRTLSNNGETASWAAETGNNRIGKFFPRGCRGWINAIDVHCKDAAAAGGTITVYISPHPSMGYIASADVTVPAEGPAAWRSATFNRMWNYDSMFIFILCSVSDVQYGYDAEAPADAFYSTDSGATWAHWTRRVWVRVQMKAMTVGDLPVSGTINTIEIVNVSSVVEVETVTVQEASTETIFELNGSGQVNWIMMTCTSVIATNVDNTQMFIRITIDGVLKEIVLNTYLGLVENVVNTPTPVTFTKINNTEYRYKLAFTRPLPFQRSFKLELRNSDETDDISSAAIYSYELRG